MKRLNVPLSTRFISGSILRFVLFVITAIITPFVPFAFIPGSQDSTFPGLTFAVFYALLITPIAYSYFRCGIFFTDTEIVEKKFFKTSSMKFSEIGSMSLDMISGARYRSVFICLNSNNVQDNMLNEVKNPNLFNMLFYKAPGQMQLETIQLIVRKKTAWKFARDLLKVIREHGNKTATVTLPEADERDSHKFGYHAITTKFWQNFTEN